ncbi:MAG: hypothetical protein AB7P02_25985 [Alphaproteobacteria bacterium]
MDLVSAVLLSIAAGAASPAVFVPAIVVGWIARSARMATLGAVAIAAVLIGMAAMEPLPEGARRVWWLMPLGVVAPLAWTLAVFALRRWLGRRTAARPGDPLARGVWSILGLIAGGLVGGVIGLLLGMAYVELAEVSSFEGLAGYTVMFLFVLPGILIGMIAGAILGWRLPRARVASGTGT